MKLFEVTRARRTVGTMRTSQGEDPDAQDQNTRIRTRAERAEKFKSGESDLMKVISRYKKNLEICLDKNILLFRASENHRGFKTDDTTHLHWMEHIKRTERRTSIYMSDSLLMHWIDKSWEGFPSRSLSYFSTQSRRHAADFGMHNENSLIIPADNIKAFGYCENDFNLSNQNHVMRASGLYKFYRSMIIDYFGFHSYPPFEAIAKHVFISRGLSIDETKVTNENVDKIVDALNDLVDNTKQFTTMIRKFNEQNPGHGSQGEIFITALEDFRAELRGLGFSSVQEMMEDITPEHHHAKVLHSLSELSPGGNGEGNEIWFEGTYLAFNFYGQETIEDLYQLLKYYQLKE